MFAFIAYAVINGDTDYGNHDGPMPLYSNMFRFWPLAGNLTFALGTVLLCVGLLTHRATVPCAGCSYPIVPLNLLLTMAFSMACSLGVVSSAEDFGYTAIVILHYIFTGGFMIGAFFVFSILVKYNIVVADAKNRWIQRIAIPVLQACIVSFVILACASASAMLITMEDARPMMQTLAACEFLLLLSFGIGYTLLFPWLFPNQSYPPIPKRWSYLFY